MGVRKGDHVTSCIGTDTKAGVLVTSCGQNLKEALAAYSSGELMDKIDPDEKKYIVRRCY